MNPLLRLAALALLASPVLAQAEFRYEMTDPAFRVVVPSLPAMTLELHPHAAKGPHLRRLGSQGPYSVSILTPTSAAGMSPTDCANVIFAELPKRPGVPAQEKVYKARLDENTFIAIYGTQQPSGVMLQAHLVSAVRGTHCVEVHAARTATSEQDAKDWFGSFVGARIEPL
ncbi:MAG: hypothetical protein JWP22_2232 [Ramlibacter sp.]|jgi:hypothetical protein|nr:hypothetical protein [Ramlibacter sp.]MDB5913557.1 hypothetical protein [Ramlibacter sp.]